MKLRSLFGDEDAVSPVIGVILMVAITVILAAVIATFVLGLGDQVSNTAPQASFTFDYNNGVSNPASKSDLDDQTGSYDAVVNITHAGGATFKAQNLYIRNAPDVNDGNWATGTSGAYSEGSEVKAGDQLTFAIDSDDTIRVTWESETGQKSAVLREFSGPDA